MHLFLMAVLGLPCLKGTFSSCSERGLLLNFGARTSHCSGFSGCRAQVLELSLSTCVLQAFVSPRHVGSFRTGGETHVPVHWQAHSEPPDHQGSPLLYCRMAGCTSPLSDGGPDVLVDTGRRAPPFFTTCMVGEQYMLSSPPPPAPRTAVPREPVPHLQKNPLFPLLLLLLF